MSLAIVLQVVAWGVAAFWVGKALEALVRLPGVANLLRPECNVAPMGSPRVVVIVPARDEAASVAGCLRSLLAQDYANLAVVAINDRSEDGTDEIMEEVATESAGRLSVLHIAKLPDGWLGKTHAMAQGARLAMEHLSAEYLLFTDADIFFEPSAVRRALAEAVRTGADHFVLAPTPLVKTAGEGMMLGFLQVIGLWAARPWKVADPKARDAIGIGAFNLLRVDAYMKLGGFEALRMQILEDLTLARRVKALGMRQRIAFGKGLVTLHWAAGAMGVVRVMTKNLFAIFGFRPEILLGACVGLMGLCLEPFVGLATAGLEVPGAVTLVGILGMYVAGRRVSGISVWTALGSPFSVVLFCYSLLRSMLVTLRNGGVTWRGTFYSLTELRKNVVLLR